MSGPASDEAKALLQAQLSRAADVRLRCDVEKRIISPGAGPHLTSPYAHAVIAYTMYTYDVTPESRSRIAAAKRRASARRHQNRHPESSDSASDDDGDSSPVLDQRQLDQLTVYDYLLVDEQAAVAVTVGVSSIIKGLEYGLLSMCEGERALITVPAQVGVPASVSGRVSAFRNLYFDVTVKSALAVVGMRNGSLKITQKPGTGDPPSLEDEVSIAVRRTHPVTQIKLPFEKMTFGLGTVQSGVFDDIVLSMRQGELAIVYSPDRSEALVSLAAIQRAPQPALVVAPDAPPVVMAAASPGRSGAGRSAAPSGGPGTAAHQTATHTLQASELLQSLDVDPVLASTHLASPLSYEQRIAQANKRREIGAALMKLGQYEKAASVYRRAVCVLFAAPCLMAGPDLSQQATAMDLAAVLLTNCGRAYYSACLFHDVLEAVNLAFSCDVNYSKAHFLRAQALRRLGRCSEALEAIDRCAALTRSGGDTTSIDTERALIVSQIDADKATAEGGTTGASPSS